jgi:TonB family protein
MNRALILLLVFIPTILFGQKTKLVKNEWDYEEYYVLKKNPDVMHGEYKKYNNKGIMQIHGYYQNGVEDSIWSFYDSRGDLIQEYDVLKKDIIYFRIDENEKYKTYRIIDGAGNPNVVLDRPPLFIGGNESLAEEIMKRLRYPKELIENGTSGKVYISFVIDKTGNLKDFKIVKSLGYGMDEEVIRVFQALPHKWLPGIYNGSPVDVEYIYPVSYTLRTEYLYLGNDK